MRTTHTHVTLGVPKTVYDFISAELKEVGYDHAFIDNDEKGTVIDMHGIGLILDKGYVPESNDIVLGKNTCIKSQLKNVITFVDATSQRVTRIIVTDPKSAYSLLRDVENVFDGMNCTALDRIEHSEEALEIFKEAVYAKQREQIAKLKLEVVQLNAQIRKKNLSIKNLKDHLENPHRNNKPKPNYPSLVIPKAAYDWLMGVAGDENGKHFSGYEDEIADGKNEFGKGKYWWRSVFSKMCGVQ